MAEDSDIQYTEDFQVADKVKAAFEKNGFIILRNLLDEEEITKLKTALESDAGVLTQYYGRNDGDGRITKVVLWNQPGNDITGVLARSEKMAGTFAKLLGGEVYHYHSKVIKKEAHTGGQHVWHQDYGYWYENGCMYPDMGTLWLAVDRADRSNGCLQILEASHKFGRLDHERVGDQATINPERLRHAQRLCTLRHCVMEPGDALFFHSNIIHRSDQNSSDRRRWAFLVAYNRADNDPVFKHHHPQYSKLELLPNSAIKECSTDTDITGKDFFMGPVSDLSLKEIANKNAEKTQ